MGSVTWSWSILRGRVENELDYEEYQGSDGEIKQGNEGNSK